jgi:hypothetical protein
MISVDGGVNDTNGKYAAGINNTCGQFAASIVATSNLPEIN